MLASVIVQNIFYYSEPQELFQAKTATDYNEYDNMIPSILRDPQKLYPSDICSPNNRFHLGQISRHQY